MSDTDEAVVAALEAAHAAGWINGDFAEFMGHFRTAVELNIEELAKGHVLRHGTQFAQEGAATSAPETATPLPLEE